MEGMNEGKEGRRVRRRERGRIGVWGGDGRSEA